MFDIGVGELAVIAVVGLLVFGPDRLPDMARQVARWVRDLRRIVASARSEVTESLGVDDRYLSDPKGSLRRDVLGDDVPTPPTSRRAWKASLGLDDVERSLSDAPTPPASKADPAGPADTAARVDPDAT